MSTFTYVHDNCGGGLVTGNLRRKKILEEMSVKYNALRFNVVGYRNNGGLESIFFDLSVSTGIHSVKSGKS